RKPRQGIRQPLELAGEHGGNAPLSPTLAAAGHARKNLAHVERFLRRERPAAPAVSALAASRRDSDLAAGAEQSGPEASRRIRVGDHAAKLDPIELALSFALSRIQRRPGAARVPLVVLFFDEELPRANIDVVPQQGRLRRTPVPSAAPDLLVVGLQRSGNLEMDDGVD